MMKNIHIYTTSTGMFDNKRGGRCLPLNHILTRIFLSLSMLFVFKLALAEPYMPQNGSVVLDYLPEKITAFLNRTELLERKLEDVSINKEQREKLNKKLIKTYLAEAKKSSDMRYVSYAQHRLDKWLQENSSSEKARLLDARIKQYIHEFKGAIIQLKSLLSDYPENNEAWSLLANIQLLTGRYQEAMVSCKQLSKSSGLVDTIICQSNIMIRVGELKKANKLLEVLVPIAEKMPVQQRLWLYTSLVEINIQQGNIQQTGFFIDQAEKIIAENNMSNVYFSRIVVDYLVQKGELEKAFELIKNERNDSALMIRSAVLAKNLGDNWIFEKNKAALIQSFDVEIRRGTNRHLREHALFTLLLLDDPDEAFKLAKHNWSLQKEPEDARVLMKSVLLLGDIKQLQWVKQSIEKTGMNDYRLNEKMLLESLL